MATGDVLNNLKKLKTSLASIKFEMSVLDEDGDPKAFLPIVHYVLLRYSKNIAQWVVENGYELMGKSDSRFMEGTYKLMRTEFNYKPTLTLSQFFTTGFGERKLILLNDLIQLCKTKNVELSKQTEPKKKEITLKEVNQRYQSKKNSPNVSITSPPSVPQSTLTSPPSELFMDSIEEVHENEMGEESFLEEAQAPELAASSSSTPPATQQEEEPSTLPADPDTANPSTPQTTESPSPAASTGAVPYYEYSPAEYYTYPEGHYEYDYYGQYPPGSYPSPSYYLPEQYTPMPHYVDIYSYPPVAAIPQPAPQAPVQVTSTPSNQTVDVVKEIMESIYKRFDTLEAKFDDSLQNMHAKLLVLEGKLKFLEEKQSKAHEENLSHSASSLSSMKIPSIKLPVSISTQTTPKSATRTVLKDLTNYTQNTPLPTPLSKQVTPLQTPMSQKKDATPVTRSPWSKTSSPTMSLVSSPFASSITPSSPHPTGTASSPVAASEPQEEVPPSTTFLTAVPEAMISQPTPSVTILEAQQFIQSISQRFQKTQQLLSTP